MSPRHISRMAYGLIKALKEAEVPGSDLFQVLGTRESEWMMIKLKDLHVSLFTEESRKSINLEGAWKNTLSEKDIEEFRINAFEFNKLGKRRR